jgi:hypothetical protein
MTEETRLNDIGTVLKFTIKEIDEEAEDVEHHPYCEDDRMAAKEDGKPYADCRHDEPYRGKAVIRELDVVLP